MSDYKRLTKQAGWHKDIDLKDELGYSYIYQRLSELENKIEKGTLKEVPENAVVLTEDNAEELGNMIVKSPQMQETMNGLIKAWEKETAEKFAKRVKELAQKKVVKTIYEDYVILSICEQFVDEICKEITEG